MAELQACLASGWIGYGPRCNALEGRFERRGGAALTTTNCTAALHLAAKLCMSSERDEILVPAITFVSSAMGFRYAGMKVKLVDVCNQTGLLDQDKIEQALSPRTCAILAVHLFGQRVETGPLRALCDRRGLFLIEDCAHRIDLLDEQPLLADIACYSFNAVKEAVGGEGGLLWCRDPELAGRARSISNLGMTVDTAMRASSPAHRDYEFTDELGLKFRGFDISATLVLAGLDHLPEARRKRRLIFDVYNAAIEGRDIFQAIPRGPEDSCLMYAVRVTDHRREAIRAGFAECGIATSVHYPSLSRHHVFGSDRLAEAERLDEELLTVPCFPGMLDKEIDRVATALCLVGAPSKLIHAP
jgi:aminotransferase